MTIQEICNYSNPVWWDRNTQEFMPLLGSEADESTVWNFQEKNCTTTDDVYTLIQNSTTGAEFYLNKTLTYGEAMILWFLTLFAIVFIFQKAYNFFWGK